MQAASTPATLEYAPRPPDRVNWRKVVRRVLVPAVVAIVVIIAGWAGLRGWKGAIYRARVAEIERRCAAYPADVGRVVHEEDADRAAVLAGAGGTGGQYRSWRGPGKIRVTWWEATPVAALKSQLSLTSWRDEATVYLGPATDLDGRRRLVSVEASRGGNTTGTLGFVVREFEPGTTRQPLRQVSQMDWWCDRSAVGADSVRVFAGGPDPMDPTRFTFDFEVEGRHGTFEGRYAADPDFAGFSSLQLFVVSGPAHSAPQAVQRSGTRFVLEPNPGATAIGAVMSRGRRAAVLPACSRRTGAAFWGQAFALNEVGAVKGEWERATGPREQCAFWGV